MKWYDLFSPIVQAAIYGVVVHVSGLPSWASVGAMFMTFLCGVQVGQQLADMARGLGRWERTTR